MRTAVLALVMLLVASSMAGMAAAQEPAPPSPSPSPTSPPPQSMPPDDSMFKECWEKAQTDEERSRCVDAYCSRHPGTGWCQQYCAEHPEREACTRHREPGFGNGTHTKPAPAGNATHDGNTTRPPDGLQACARHKDAPAEREACFNEYCKEHPRDQRCERRHAAPEPQPCRKPESDGGTEPRVCKPACPVDENAHSANATRCKPLLRPATGFVRFDVGEDRSSLVDIRVNGRLVLVSLDILVDENVSVNAEAEKNVLTAHFGTDLLQIHDNPTGLIRYKGEEDVVLLFPVNATVSAGGREGDGRVWHVTYPGGYEALLVASNATWTETLAVSLNGFFTFHVAPRSNPSPDSADAEVEEGLREAREKRHIGAEIALRRTDTPSDAVEVLAFDDVRVEVELPSAVATTEDPIRVEVSANLTEGRTIAIDIDPVLLENASPEELLLRYFDINDDGSETEVLFVQASSLADVLDPTDDNGQPEYWVVSDTQGIHVLVGVTHWSIHAITVASIAETLVQPSVLVGVAAGVIGSILAAGVLLWPRRRPDEF